MLGRIARHLRDVGALQVAVLGVAGEIALSDDTFLQKATNRWAERGALTHEKAQWHIVRLGHSLTQLLRCQGEIPPRSKSATSRNPARSTLASTRIAYALRWPR